MPRRLTDQQRRARLAAALEKAGWDSQDVDNRVNDAMDRALAEVRSLQAEPIPDHIEVIKLSDQKAWERAFEAGFLACAVAFWDDIAYSRARRRDAEKGRRTAASERRRRDDAEVLSAASAYRKRNPDASMRETALHVARRLGTSAETVRHIIRAKKRASR